MRDIEKPADLLAYLRETRRVAPERCPRIQILAGGVPKKRYWSNAPTAKPGS